MAPDRVGPPDRKAGAATTKSSPAKAPTWSTLARATTVSYARDTASEDYIDCGAGFDQVETIHRDDRTLSNCERALGPRKGTID